MVNSGRAMPSFDEIVKKTVIDKQAVLSTLLSVEMIYFSRKENLIIKNFLLDIISITKKKKQDHLAASQFFTWLRNNELFGEVFDKTKD